MQSVHASRKTATQKHARIRTHTHAQMQACESINKHDTPTHSNPPHNSRYFIICSRGGTATNEFEGGGRAEGFDDAADEGRGGRGARLDCNRDAAAAEDDGAAMAEQACGARDAAAVVETPFLDEGDGCDDDANFVDGRPEA